MNRPFYTEYAWAYDLLIQAPVASRVDFIVGRFNQSGILPRARLLDAGCGTGTYSIALAERRFSVTGIDASLDLITQARKKSIKVGIRLEFVIGDILRLPQDLSVDAVLCRGVLNDLIEIESRKAVFSSFAGVMREGGVLMLDVREWNATVVRKTKNPVFEKTVMTENGQLTFRSITTLREETRSLLISETHTLQSPRGENIIAFDFEMKCWTQKELTAHLSGAGFDIINYLGDYDSAISVGDTDRLVAVAVLAEKAKAQERQSSRSLRSG